jgi:hypothetical protein
MHKRERLGKRKARPARRAAPPTDPELPDRERILWLLDFLRRDVTTLRPGELITLRNGVFPHLHWAELATVTVHDADELRALGPVPPTRADMTSQQVIAAARDLMAGLQDALRIGVQGLQETGSWWPFALDRPAPHWSLERRPDGTVQRAYMGSWRTITLAVAADLLVRWWSQLRRCEHEPCRAWFLPTHGRQRYHDPRCSADVRYQRFKPTRDYKAEYARRYDSTRTSVRRQSSRRTK